MAWVVRMAIDFEEEFAILAGPVQTELLANACLIARFGPHLGRPRVDTLTRVRQQGRSLRGSFLPATDCPGGAPVRRPCCASEHPPREALSRDEFSRRPHD